MKKLLIFLLPFLTACATSEEYKSYLQAQADANKITTENQKPLVEIMAQPGQQITGLASIRVYTPTQAPIVQQARPNEWAAIVGQGLGVIGTVGSIYQGGKAAIGLASEIRQAGTAGYPYIQAPTTTTSTTMTNSTGVLGSGTYQIDNTHAPTVVNQPAPIIVNQPDPLVVNQPAPIIVNQPPVIVTPDPGWVVQ